MVQYYTLEQAAQLLQTSAEKLKEMAKKNEVRAFQDRGTLRFRSQEIDELARARGLGSDPELQLGEAAPAKPADSPPPAPHAPDVSLNPEDSGAVPIGREPKHEATSPKSPSPKSSGRKGPKSPPPKASSDSDVRLIADSGDLDFQIAPDSDPKVLKDPVTGAPKSGPRKAPPGPVAQPDSGVRIVPLDQASDSDVKIVPDSNPDTGVAPGESPGKRPSDSDIRLEKQNPSRPRSDDALVTEEIDLDAEARKVEEAAKGKKSKRPKSSPQLPTKSPFDLSDSEIKGKESGVHKKPKEAKGETDSSDDFELKPGGKDSSPIELTDEEVGLGELRPAGSGDSGINVQDPADSGISLEQGGADEIEFELSLDASSTPKPGPAKVEKDSDSEFELSLDADSSSDEMTAARSSDLDSSSDEMAAAKDADSDSEFELTLDESGELAPVEESGSGEKDIFETDFEVPALDEESGSEAVALEDSDSSDLESSDFDLALSDEDMSSEEESGSQVVALEDEEEADEGAETVSRPRPKVGAAAAVAGEEELGEGLEDDLGAVAEEEEEAPAAVEAAPAEWGALPALVLLPCVILLFLVGLMGFELVQGMWGYQQGGRLTGPVTQGIAKIFLDKDALPKD